MWYRTISRTRATATTCAGSDDHHVAEWRASREDQPRAGRRAAEAVVESECAGQWPANATWRPDRPEIDHGWQRLRNVAGKLPGDVSRTSSQAFRTSPSSTIAAQGAITAAQDVANSLNNATKSVQAVRQGADKEIATQVSTLEHRCLRSSRRPTMRSRALPRPAAIQPMRCDERDKLAEADLLDRRRQRGRSRSNGDMALYTTDGTVVFDTIPRTITFRCPEHLYRSDEGQRRLHRWRRCSASGKGSTSTAQGSLQALLQVRDEIATTFQSQLDEIAKVARHHVLGNRRSAAPPRSPAYSFGRRRLVPQGGTPTTTGVDRWHRRRPSP